MSSGFGQGLHRRTETRCLELCPGKSEGRLKYSFVVEGPAIGDAGGQCQACGENLEGAHPIEGKLGLEDGGVGAFLGTLADGCSGVRSTPNLRW